MRRDFAPGDHPLASVDASGDTGPGGGPEQAAGQQGLVTASPGRVPAQPQSQPDQDASGAAGTVSPTPPDVGHDVPPARRRGATRRRVVAGAAVTGLGALVATGVARRLIGSSRGVHRDALVLFGAPGSFGEHTGGTSISTVDVPGWGFGPGQAAYASTVTSDGTVFTATTPFSDNQAQPTGTGMELAVFEPGPLRFTRLVVPSSTGRTELPRSEPWYRGVGGADIADVTVIGSGLDERVVFVSAMSYFGWDTTVYGRLPVLGQVRRPAPGRPWRYDPTRSWTTDQLAASAPPGVSASAFPVERPGEPRWSRGPAAITRLPRSGHLVIAQYFGAGSLGTDQGSLLVVDTAGRVRASWQYPEVRVFGMPVVVSPREVVADPTSTAGDERFVLISDCRTLDDRVVSFPIQEFSYSVGTGNRTTGTITPRSNPVRASADDSRMETACFDANGTLYVARTRADGLRAAALAVYPKIGSERGLVTRTPTTDGWPVGGWGAVNPPDYLVAGTDRGGLVRSIVVDPDSGAVMLAGLDGTVQVVRPSGRGADMTFAAGRPIDIGLGRLRGPSTRYIGVRRGAVDVDRRVMWLPVNQLVLDSIAWPYPPFKLDQWLMRIDLRAVLA
ncbi:hypothetical protein [Frankia sp. Cppng1_Ct_nod]|uniref:hypothetical protein n=1 Tax=Frankia sp. Cppng1_Ct_nod TaxID=2897162 RepID=UPI001F5ED1CC|nr:hypothetical protein [Frankia sp. Cppng1_Ct_nod]